MVELIRETREAPYDSVLDGTPYSLPPEAAPALAEMRIRLRRARTDLNEALKAARSMGLVEELTRAHDVFTVYESNSLEFTGPDLAGTFKAINSGEGQDIIRSLNANLLPQMLRRDPEAYAAIGLELARVVAHRYVTSDTRGISQSDLRSLHSIVMKGSHFAGRYRSMDVSISKSEHAPFPEYAIDPTMQDYASWSKRDCHPDLAVLRAAVGHAWFTHVHPFYDGNGRVARLTTNVMLGQDGLPPAIVKAKSQRGQYLAALAHSDEGGDILPLVGLFLSTVERYVADLSRPKAFKKMFDDLVARRGNSYFAFYAECVSQFVKRLATELALYDLTLVRVDQLTREDFDNLRTTISGDYGSYYSWPSQRRRRPSPVMTAVIADAKGNEVVLYQTLATAESRRQLTPEEYVPSFGFALPDRKFRLMPHRRATRSEMSGLGSLWVLPGRSVHVFAPGVLPNRGSRLEEATGVIAARLRQAFAAGFSTPEDHLGSTRWLPRINGGQL